MSTDVATPISPKPDALASDAMSRNGTAVVITLESKFEGFSYGVSKNIRLFCEFIPSLKKITIDKNNIYFCLYTQKSKCHLIFRFPNCLATSTELVAATCIP